MAQPSAQARKLVEDLHEPIANEVRWEIATRYLKKAYDQGYRDCDAGIDPRPIEEVG
jgi:hypothetical protein